MHRLKCDELMEHEYFDGFREEFESELAGLHSTSKSTKQKKLGYRTRETRVSKPSYSESTSKNHLPQLGPSLDFNSPSTSQEKEHTKKEHKKYDGHLPSIPPR